MTPEKSLGWGSGFLGLVGVMAVGVTSLALTARTDASRSERIAKAPKQKRRSPRKLSSLASALIVANAVSAAVAAYPVLFLVEQDQSLRTAASVAKMNGLAKIGEELMPPLDARASSMSRVRGSLVGTALSLLRPPFGWQGGRHSSWYCGSEQATVHARFCVQPSSSQWMGHENSERVTECSSSATTLAKAAAPGVLGVVPRAVGWSWAWAALTVSLLGSRGPPLHVRPNRQVSVEPKLVPPNTFRQESAAS